eukprot:6654098-Alexandrium_andersonii.AAC.1
MHCAVKSPGTLAALRALAPHGPASAPRSRCLRRTPADSPRMRLFPRTDPRKLPCSPALFPFSGADA